VVRRSDEAVVVGAGPNGLSAAVTLARAGLVVTVLEAAADIGGGTRTAELTVPGVLHDVCSAVHPLAVASPFLASLPLEAQGLEWRWPEVDLAHPLADGRVGVMVRSISDTAAGLGVAGPAWRRTFGPLAERFPHIAEDTLGPLVRVPRHPVTLGRFGIRAGLPATVLARRFPTAESAALFAGTAAHACSPLGGPASAAVGVMLTSAGHAVGWPVAAGGSQAITNALAGVLRAHGGTIETGVEVRSLSDLDGFGIVLFDTAPSALARIAGARLDHRVHRSLTRWRHGPAAFKVDLAVERGVPWASPACRRAGTVHLGGTLPEVVAAESDVWRGRMPTRPFVLVAQQYLCDPSRSAGDVHPVYAYAHVPNGYDGDATESVLEQIERYAPGVRDRIMGIHVSGPAALERSNPNYVGGDMLTGANSPRQLVLRPRLSLSPYRTGIPGVYLCSAATPPGAGAHGMSGHNAASAALFDLRRGRREASD
jgi:phytoene dehydrogenase-like protein